LLCALNARQGDIENRASEALFLLVYHQKSSLGLCGSHLAHIEEGKNRTFTRGEEKNWRS